MSIRTYPKTPRIYLDMDGVLADFERDMIEYGLPASRLKLIPGAYRDLKPISGAINGVHSLLEMGFFVLILTKIPSENPFAATAKIQWLNEHLPVLEDLIIITPDKGCVGTHDDFLVDDFPEWANAHNFPGTVIKFSGKEDVITANHHVTDWKELVYLFAEKRKGLIKLGKLKEQDVG